VSESSSPGATQTETLRLFLAVELPPPVQASVAKTLKDLQTGCQFVGAHPAWVRPESLHLTLVFLGFQPPHARASAEDAARRAVAGIPPFDLTVSGVSLFPTPRNPRTVAMGLHGALDAAALLQRRCAEECRASGFVVEDREFRPHVTLARIKSLKGGSALKEIVAGHRTRTAGRFTVDSVVLFHSHLLSDGAHYKPLCRAPLEALADGRQPPAGQLYP
jgi:RNA 2',3'-cyclic 3'-phosphodiesterase